MIITDFIIIAFFNICSSKLTVLFHCTVACLTYSLLTVDIHVCFLAMGLSSALGSLLIFLGLCGVCTGFVSELNHSFFFSMLNYTDTSFKTFSMLVYCNSCVTAKSNINCTVASVTFLSSYCLTTSNLHAQLHRFNSCISLIQYK